VTGAVIDVKPAGEGSSATHFTVTVRDGGSDTTHQVTVTDGDYRRMGERFDSYEDFVRACFEFLLEREPKESILPTFDVAEIARYFPEFEGTITGTPD
jgi:hypothetical protein